MKSHFLLLMVGIVLCFPAISVAQVYKGTLKLHLDSQLLGYKFKNFDFEEASEEQRKAFALGLGSPHIGMGIGAAAVENLVIGARLAGYFDTEKIDGTDAETKVSHWSILPYAEYVFSTGVVRPVIMLTLGLMGDVVEGIGDAESNAWMFHIGLGGGISFFLGHRFSLDLAARLGYGIGQMEETLAEDQTREARVDQFNVNILLGISGWI